MVQFFNLNFLCHSLWIVGLALKNHLFRRGQAEKEFKVEVEAIGRVRHKNLVRLLGYCAEGAHRYSVFFFQLVFGSEDEPIVIPLFFLFNVLC